MAAISGARASDGTARPSDQAVGKTDGPIADSMSIVQAQSGKAHALVRDAAY
ncbi:hypothetical protein QZM18_20110 [Burkholderia diffusa]|uniref:hypothetical protein n=1 Tax=Burkholderia diffusa TaxID=488732 RepID=UPI0026541863|nr:hypothetical protein [Burkholderia diffusa]MDN7906404.1 hypothetical protein [Burkholderia diffusa]